MPPSPSDAGQRRLDGWRGYGILDAPREAAFDDIALLASRIRQTPIAAVNLVDQDRQRFNSEIGRGVRETPPDTSICAYAILQQELSVVADTLEDPRFRRNPLLSRDPHLCFHAGVLLKTPDGLPPGTACVLGVKPRELRPEQAEALRAPARQAMRQIELRRLLAQAHASNHWRSRLMAIAGHGLKTPARTASMLSASCRASCSRAGGRQQSAGADRSRIHPTGRHGRYRRPDRRAGPGRSSWPTRSHPCRRTGGNRPRPKAYGCAMCRPGYACAVTPRGWPPCSATWRAITERGTVLIGCRRRSDRMRVEVIDIGLGVDDVQSSKLFHAFRQFNPRSEGPGLGL